MNNNLQRRQFVKDHVIDATVAKAAVSHSRRERIEAAKTLRKALVASRSAGVSPETISYPR